MVSNCTGTADFRHKLCGIADFWPQTVPVQLIFNHKLCGTADFAALAVPWNS
jgi:hypothetical protein